MFYISIMEYILRYDRFESAFLHFLSDLDWQAIAGESESEEEKAARADKHLLGAQRGSVNTFHVQMRANGKRMYLGTFKSEEEAHEAYKAASLKYHGEFSVFANAA